MPNEATLKQSERLACTQILDFAKRLFQDPQNAHAYQIWLQSKEEKQNGNYSDQRDL